MSYKAVLRKKSDFQKDSCIGWLYGCKAPSIMEAAYKSACIRCCEKDRCITYAVKLAIDIEDGKL